MSPSTERVTEVGPATRPGNQPGQARVVRPSREQRLHRSVAVALPSVDDLIERDDDEADIDPYLDIPEELEPDDPDEPTSSFPVAERDGRRRPTPSISFSDFTGWAGRPDPGAGSHGRVSAAPTSSVPGLRIRVTHNTTTGQDRDDVAAVDADDDLDAIAAAVGGIQYAAVVANGQAEAYDALVPMTQKTLAETAGLDEPSVSRRRRAVVQCPWGLVPLEFFCWKKSTTALRAADARALAGILLAEPAITDLASARRVAETIGHTAEEVRRLADALRHQVRVLRVLLHQLPLVNGMASALAMIDIEELEATLNDSVEAALGAALTARGKGLVRLGLAGAFAGLEVQ